MGSLGRLILRANRVGERVTGEMVRRYIERHATKATCAAVPCRTHAPLAAGRFIKIILDTFSYVGKGLFERKPFFYVRSRFRGEKIYAIQMNGFLFSHREAPSNCEVKEDYLTLWQFSHKIFSGVAI